uniref:Dehydrogenase/reductase SDR family member 7 n=1 Tax=Timema cristinae TaxID=61476 RepID=A0A7R9CYR6_TIMCR|nr:unnamed protein product [Timema cristinae]
MDLLALVGFIVVVYWLVYIVSLFWFDCDLGLAWTEKFGKSISALAGKVVWVTGASSGIGEHLAIELARHGVKLVLSARREEELDRVRNKCLGKKLEGREGDVTPPLHKEVTRTYQHYLIHHSGFRFTGGPIPCVCVTEVGKLLEPTDVLTLPLDVTSYNDHQAAFDTVIQYFGKVSSGVRSADYWYEGVLLKKKTESLLFPWRRIRTKDKVEDQPCSPHPSPLSCDRDLVLSQLDVLVNNAGRSQRCVWEEVELEVDKQMFELNVFGVIHLTRIAVRYFLEKGTGHVAVTSSIAGVQGVPFSGTYTATKHALHGYMNSLRNEKYGRNLDVTLLCPGPVFTNFLAESFTGKANEKFGKSVNPDDRRMTAERCGHLCAVALANKSSEVWMAPLPIIPLAYIFVYFPNVGKVLGHFLGAKYFLKLRDSRESVQAN